MAKPKKTKRLRVNIRMPSPLLNWAKQYAADSNRTFTQLVVDSLTDIKETASNGELR